MSTVTLIAEDLEATDRIGRRLGAALRLGHVIGLVGPLGSGKTTLIKAIAAGAGVPDARQVNSPTFVIVNEYDAVGPGTSLHLYHIDAYRLGGSSDLENIGFDEMDTLGAVLIEWADRVAELLPDDHLSIRIDPLDDHRRRFHCAAAGPTAAALLDALNPTDPLSDTT